MHFNVQCLICHVKLDVPPRYIRFCALSSKIYAGLGVSHHRKTAPFIVKFDMQQLPFLWQNKQVKCKISLCTQDQYYIKESFA